MDVPLKSSVQTAVDARIWKASHLGLMWSHVASRPRRTAPGATDRDHLRASVEWLERAQDVTGDGGVSGRYLLKTGWTTSYPETTGYIIPTFLALAEHFGEPRFRERARRSVEFLLPLQMSEGAFPGGEMDAKPARASAFNTGQILAGLTAWHAATGDRATLAAAERAAEWLASIQDEDGAFRRHTYLGLASTYSAHASCWLAEFGRHANHQPSLTAASRHLDWVLRNQDAETGWFDGAGFSTADHAQRVAVTHTIAYTIWGVLASSIALGREDGVEAARRAADRVARRLEISGWLPGRLDHRWRPAARFACLTGNAQMALIWFRLYERTGDGRFVNAALKALDQIKAAQRLDSAESGIRGGVPGSDPLWGDYIRLGLPNWAAKFFIDALLAKQKAVEQLRRHARSAGSVRADLPQSVPSGGASRPARPLRVVLYTRSTSYKVPQMVSAWSAWGFRPSHVIVEKRAPLPLLGKLRQRVSEEGLTGLTGRLVRQRFLRTANPYAPLPGVKIASYHIGEGELSEFCASRQIPIVEVDSLDSPEGIAAVRALQPDVAIHAGGGILRAPILAIPRLGTLNAHMGILPAFRGMNVTEWATLLGGPVGCTVHCIDPGIDTGDIICVSEVDVRGASSIPALRALVDERQVALLGDVVRYAMEHDELPPRHQQQASEGRQYFRMHPEIAAILHEQLESGIVPRVEAA
jgi:hypothetical protein